MTRQPIFATLTDNQGGRAQTLSARGPIHSIRVWVNSEFGEVFSASINHSEPKFPKIYKRGRSKKEYDCLMAEIEERKQKETFVSVNLDFEESQNFKINVNGITLSNDIIKSLKALESYKFERQFEMMKLAMKGKPKENPLQILEALKVMHK